MRASGSAQGAAAKYSAVPHEETAAVRVTAQSALPLTAAELPDPNAVETRSFIERAANSPLHGSVASALH